MTTSVAVFDQLNLFACLNPEQRALVQPLFVFRDYVDEAVIFEQGDAAEYLYVVAEGGVHILYKPDDGPEITIARVRPEGVAGWSAVLGTPSYTSTAVCEGKTRLLRVHGADLRTLCERHPETGRLVIEQLADVIAERLQGTHAQVLALLEQGMRLGAKKTVAID
jgi:CRP/FNR family transcriptional regulator